MAPKRKAPARPHAEPRPKRGRGDLPLSGWQQFLVAANAAHAVENDGEAQMDEDYEDEVRPPADEADAAPAAAEQPDAAQNDAASSSNASRYTPGQHGARGRPDPSPPPSAGKRRSAPPQRHDPSEGPPPSKKKSERKRKMELEEQVEDNVPELAYIGDARTTAREIARELRSGCHGAPLNVLAPGHRRSAHCSLLGGAVFRVASRAAAQRGSAR